MNILIVLAILVTARLIVEFFGQLSSQSWGESIIAITHPLVVAFGVDGIKTPYGGVFDVNAAIMVLVFLAAEWLFSMIRSRD